jgi:hypothetical protein
MTESAGGIQAAYKVDVSDFADLRPVPGPDLPAFNGTGLAGQLKQRGVRRVAVCGLATDYCVLNTALDAIAAGFETLVLPEAMRTVDVTPAMASARSGGWWRPAQCRSRSPHWASAAGSCCTMSTPTSISASHADT